MTDDEIERMVQEAAELGPMGLDEFQEATRAIRAYARQAGLESGPAGDLDLGELKHRGRLGRRGAGW